MFLCKNIIWCFNFYSIRNPNGDKIDPKAGLKIETEYEEAKAVLFATIVNHFKTSADVEK